jgi:ubiquinone/menaquinone biosynthesis C-methylase UbiE
LQDGLVKDWVAWHAAYDDPASSLAARLHRVQGHLASAINHAPGGPVRILSLCAGQGHDVLGVLPEHPRRADVHAVLIETDPHNVRQARRRAADAGLSQVEVRQADASRVANYADALPADVLLLCGIFGNVSPSDIQRTIEAAPALCAVGGTVIWTRHRRPADLTGELRRWLHAAGFDEVAFDALDTDSYTGIGVHRLGHAATSGLPDGPLFTFLSAADP